MASPVGAHGTGVYTKSPAPTEGGVERVGPRKGMTAGAERRAEAVRVQGAVEPLVEVPVGPSSAVGGGLQRYGVATRRCRVAHPLKVLAAYAPYEVLEGEGVLGVFVGEWPSMEAAKAWYDSPGYEAIRHLRMDNAKDTGVVVEAGFAPAQERSRNRIR